MSLLQIWKSTIEVWHILQARCLHMLSPRFAMLLKQIHSLKFLQIQTVKVIDIEHGGLYHLKGVHFSVGLVRVLYPLV
jgi:hypothetical protein